MRNLNELIRNQSEWTFKIYPITVKLNLTQRETPVLDELAMRDYRKAFAQLYDEVIGTNPAPKKVRITSELEQMAQIIKIEHNGMPISEMTLNWLNRCLEECATGARSAILSKDRNRNFYRNRNFLAATLLHKYNGRIQISNIDGIYHVQTKVEIPIP